MINEIKDRLSSQIDSEYLDIIDESPNHGSYTGKIGRASCRERV